MWGCGWSAAAMRARLVKMGCCPDDEDCLLVANAKARLAGSSLRSGCVVLTSRRLLVVTRHRTLLLCSSALSCELRVELTGITRIVRDNQGTYVNLETSLGCVRLESSALTLQDIVKKLLEARGKQLKVAALGKSDEMGCSSEERVMPGSAGATGWMSDIADEGDCCSDSRQAKATPSLRSGVPATSGGRKSFISTGENFDRLRRSSAVKELFPADAVRPLERAEGGLQSPASGALHRIITEGTPQSSGLFVSDEHNPDEQAQDAQLTNTGFRSRKSVISTAHNFDRFRRSFSLHIGKLRPASPSLAYEGPSHPSNSESAGASVSSLQRCSRKAAPAAPVDAATLDSADADFGGVVRGRGSLHTLLDRVLRAHDAERRAIGEVLPALEREEETSTTKPHGPTACKGSFPQACSAVQSDSLQDIALSKRRTLRPGFSKSAVQGGGVGGAVGTPLARASLLVGAEDCGGSRAGPISLEAMIAAEAMSAASVLEHSHRKKQQPHGGNATLMEGWLMKQRRSGVTPFRCWQRRWFQLSAQTLTYTRCSLGRWRAEHNAVRCISLADISKVLYFESSRPGLVLVVQKGRKHIKLRACHAHADDLDRWLQVLQYARKVLALQTPCSEVEANPVAFMDIGKDVLLDKLQEHIADLLTAQPQASTACSQLEGNCAFSADLGRLELVVQSMATAVVACYHNQGQLPPVALSLSLSLSMGTRVGEGRADMAERLHERPECLGLIAAAYTETIGARLEELLTNHHACTPARQGSRLSCADTPSTSSHSEPFGSVGVSPCSRGQYRTGLFRVVMWALRYERTIKHLCGSLRRCQIPAHLHGWRHAMCSLGLDACKTSYACTGWGHSVPSLHGCPNTVVLHCGVLRVYSGLDCASTTDDAHYKRSGSNGVGASCARGNIDGFRECWGGRKVCSDMELAVRVSRLQGCQLFRSLSSDQLLWLAAFASTTRFSAGEVVSAAVDERVAPQGTMAVIVDGSAILSPRLDGDNSAGVTRLGPSDSFMLASSLLNEPVGVSIRAATAVQVCVLPVEHVQLLLRQDAAFLRETAFAIHREMESYSIIASPPPAPSVSTHSDPRSQSAQDAIIARLATRVGARSASTMLHAAPLWRMSARICGLKESFFADEFLDVLYSHCRPCLVVIVLLAGDGMTSLDASADRYAGAGSGICKAPDASRRKKGTFLLRFSDHQTARAWAEALGKYVWREGGLESPGVGGLRRRKDVGIVNGEQDTSILNNLASLVAFGSSPSGTRQSVDSQVRGIFAKHINQNDRELDLHGLLLGCRECVIALERALEDLDLASSQVDLAKEVAEVYLESIFAQARLHLTATFPQHPNRKCMIDILCLFLTELPVILDKWALAESVGPHLRKLALGPIFDRLTSCYLACMQASLHKLITNICLRDVCLYRDDTYPDAAYAAGQTVDVGEAGGGELGEVAEEGNGRVRSYLVEDLSCVMERELDLCTEVESGEFQSRVYVTCFRTCLDVVEKYRIFGRHVSGPYCVRQGAAEDPGVQGLSDTISNSALASSCHSSASTTAFSSIFTTFSTTSRALENGRSTSITLRAACVALNNASDSCHMCDRLQDRMRDSLQGRLDHSLKSPGAHHSFFNPEKALSKLHEHFLVCARLAEAEVVDACVCRLTAAGFFVDASGECWEMFSKVEEATYREVEALLVDVSSYLSDALCQDKGRRDEQMNDESERGLRHGTKEHGGGGEGHRKEAGCTDGEIRKIFSDGRESNYSDASSARNEKDRGQWQERTTRKNVSYWARRVCARLLDFFVTFHVEALRVFLSDSKCPPPLQTVVDTLETVFKMYLETCIISAKLLPLQASIDLLTCSLECIKERVAQHLEGGVHGDVCRICCLSRDLCPDTAGQIDALLRGSETLMSNCDRHGSPGGQRTSLVASWSRSLARMQLSRSSGHAATARQRWDASSSAWGRWGLLGARQPAESPGFVEDTLVTRGTGTAGSGEDEGLCDVQDSLGKVPEMAKIESGSTLASPPSSLLSYWTDRW